MSSRAVQRTLVTGGAGFIGSTLVDALVRRGDEVTVLDALSTGRRENLEDAEERGVRFVRADVRDAAAVDAVVAGAAPQRIFHLAAQIDVRRSLEDPAHDAAVNVLGTINVLEAARRHGVQRIVNTSTGGAIYGAADVIPTPEGTEPRPMAAYGTSKLCAEQYCAWYARLHGLSVATVRLANVYGPRQDPLGEAGVIAIFCDRLLAGAPPLIYGDGTQTRDFVFVEDVVAAQIALADTTFQGPVNVGTGRETSVLQLAAAVARAGDVDDFVPVLMPAREGEVDRSCLDASRACERLAFTAEVPLVEGLERTLRWILGVRVARATAAAAVQATTVAAGGRVGSRR